MKNSVLNIFYQFIWHPDVGHHNKIDLLSVDSLGFIVFVSLYVKKTKHCVPVMYCNGNDAKTLSLLLIHDMTDYSFEFVLCNDLTAELMPVYTLNLNKMC